MWIHCTLRNGSAVIEIHFEHVTRCTSWPYYAFHCRRAADWWTDLNIAALVSEAADSTVFVVSLIDWFVAWATKYVDYCLGAVLTESPRKWTCWHGTLGVGPLGHSEVGSVGWYLRGITSCWGSWGMFQCTCMCSLQMGDVVNVESTIIQIQGMLQPFSCVTALTRGWYDFKISFTRCSVKYIFLVLALCCHLLLHWTKTLNINFHNHHYIQCMETNQWGHFQKFSKSFRIKGWKWELAC